MHEPYKPDDLGLWLARVNVGDLSDADARLISAIDLEDDIQLAAMVRDWLRPWYLLHSDLNRLHMREVLAAADHWSIEELRAVFDAVAFPSGQDIKDIPRFLAALKKATQE